MKYDKSCFLDMIIFYQLIVFLLFYDYNNAAVNPRNPFPEISEHLKIEAKIPDMVNIMREERTLYDNYGFLTLVSHGKKKNKIVRTSDIPLFFKERLTTCKAEGDNDNNLFFDLVACIPFGENCPTGIKICYESELSEDIVNNKKFVMYQSGKDEKSKCRNPNWHALTVAIENGYGKIYSSIDENVYSVKLPIRKDPLEKNSCFKIRVGTEDSVATVITDLDDKPLEVEPRLDTWSDSILRNGWTESANKFSFFALDFIPHKKEWFLNYGDYFKNFKYEGKYEGVTCNQILRFEGEKLHRCYKEWVDTGLSCPGPYYSVELRNLYNKTNECKEPEKEDPNILQYHCTFQLIRTSEKRDTRISRDITTSGIVQEKEEHEKLVIFPNKVYTGKNVLRNMKRMWSDLDTKDAREKLDREDSSTKLSQLDRKDYYASEGCYIKLLELYINCNGWRLKTGIFHPSHLPYPEEKKVEVNQGTDNGNGNTDDDNDDEPIVNPMGPSDQDNIYDTDN